MELNLNITSRSPLVTGGAGTIVQKNLDRFMDTATLFLLAEVKKRTPQGVYGAQGGLLASIQSEVSGKGTPAVKGRVLTAHAYAEVVEKGRRPNKGMPPKGVLLRWLEVKLGLTPHEAERVEFVVRRKIAVKGTEGAHMFEQAISDNMGRLEAMAKRCGLAIVADMGRPS